MKSCHLGVLDYLASSGSYADHIAQAAHNEQFVGFLSPQRTQYPDWVATGAFYLALHCVNASAVKAGINWRGFPPWLSPAQRRKISQHTKRVIYVRTYFLGLFRDYNRLLTESFNARYDPLYRKQVKPATPDTLFKIACLFKKVV